MSPVSRRGRYTLIVALLIFTVLAGALLYASTKAARLVSGALTDALGQPVSVSLVGFSPSSGLTLYGVEVKNPEGFKSTYLLNIKSLNITPDYRELAHRRLVFVSLGVFSPSLYLEQGKSGKWNFQPLLDRLGKGERRRFTVSETRIRAGRLTLVDRGVTLYVTTDIGKLSSIEPAPTPFRLALKDDKGSTLTCEGEAGIFTKTKTLKAKAAFKGEKMGRYISSPKGLDLHDSSLNAALEFSYEKGLATAQLTGKLAKVNRLDAKFEGDARYLTDTGALEVRAARLTLPGVSGVSLSGRMTGIPADPAFDLTVTPSPVELAKLAPYLPPGTGAEGVIRIEPVHLRGTFKGGPLQTAFRFSGSDMAVKSAGFSARSAVLAGDAVWNGKSLAVSGGLSVRTGLVNGHPVDYFAANFAWSPGSVTLTGISLKASELTASAGPLSIAYSGGSVRASVKGLAASYGKDANVKDAQLSATAILPAGGRKLKVDGSFSLPSGEAWGAGLAGFAGNLRYSDGATGLDLTGQLLANPVTFNAGVSIPSAGGLKNPYLSGKINITHAESLNPLLAKSGLKQSFKEGSLSLVFSAKGDDLERIKGSAELKADGLGLDLDGKPLLRGLSFELRPDYVSGSLTLPETGVSFGGSFKLAVSGKAARDGKGWSGALSARLPETPLASLQEGALDALPPTLKWADLGGNAALDARLELNRPASGTAGGRLTGSLTLKGATISIPDQKVSVGPADGTVPLGFSFGGPAGKPGPEPFRQEPFEREEFSRLIKKYSQRPGDVSLTIRKAAYGLFELDDIEMALVAGDGWYELDWLGLKGFGSSAYGYGLADFAGGKGGRYAVSLLLTDFSLAELCRRVPGINGYLSGKVAGMARLFATGSGYRSVAGAASFWTYEAGGEDMTISKEFLKRLMGKSSKAYLLMGDRSFDKGELDAIFSGGYIVFDKLLIEHTNFLGRQDLKVTVAPISNKVAIEHLLEVMKDVSERAGAIK